MDADNIVNWVALSSVIIVLYPLWRSFQTSPPTLLLPTETMVAAFAAAILAHITFYHYSHQYRSMCRKAWTKPGFISPERVGRVMSGPDSSHPSRRNNTSPPFILSSSLHSPDNESHTPGQDQQQYKSQSAAPSMSAPLFAQEQHQQQQHKEVLNGLGIENMPGRLRLDQLTTNAPEVEVIPKETLDIIRSHPGYRIWHLIIVGEGCEALKTACQLAELHPSRPILVVLEDDIRAGFVQRVVQRVVQRMEKLLTAQMHRLWAQEALKAVPTSWQKGAPIATKDTNAPLHELCEAVFDKTRPMDDLTWLPDNVFIGCGLRVSKILINKPIMALNVATTPPVKPIQRFSSSRGDLPSNLTINTTPLKPAETLGVEVVAAKGPKGKRYQLFTGDGLVFACNKHPLIRSLDARTSPPTSRDGAGGRRASSLNHEEPSGPSKIMFSISMQHLRPKDRAAVGYQFTHWPRTVYQQLLASASRLLGRFSRKEVESQYLPAQNNPNPDIHSVLLHQSYRVVHKGRVWPRTLDDDTREMFSLEISASATSLKAGAPTQLQVKVITDPKALEAFGNSEMIRKGETVLMEGLVMAREIARNAGWICLEEDDCQMVEWVRDQMSLQWVNEPPSVTPIQPVCPNLVGLSAVLSSGTPSSGSLRVRTPNLSPYTSRTHSYHGPRKGDLGSGEKRDSTLDRLREASENLETHEKKTDLEQDDPGAPKVTTEAVEWRAPLRPGLKTSFGGFSSLSGTRSQTLALAEATEDHLGMALSIGTTAGGLSSPEQDHNSRSFGEGVDPLDISSTNNTKLSSPDPPRKLSRFSIKSYQLERSNHGLSDKWSIGVLDANPSGVTTPPPPPASVVDLLSTPPLVADGDLSGTVSPLTPRPQDIPVGDLLQSLDAISANGRKPSYQADLSQYSDIFGNDGRVDPLSSNALSHHDKNLMDNGDRKGVGTFSLIHNESSSGGSSVAKGISSSNSVPSPLEAPVELVHDFLGDSFLTGPPKPSSAPAGRRKVLATTLLIDPTYGLENIQLAPATGLTKMVHFADGESDDNGDLNRLQKVHAEPDTTMMTSLSSSQDEDSIARPPFLMQSSTSPTFKYKAHTRRSWGQGIGGTDILGIQGLSE